MDEPSWLAALVPAPAAPACACSYALDAVNGTG
jgi:hypothetical protein